MNTSNIRQHLRRDGWLLATILTCTAICLIIGAMQPSASSEENRISRVLSAISGAGHTEVAVYYGDNAVPCGAVIVAEGADSITVRLRLTEAVSTLLGLEPSAVAVYPLKGGNP